MIQFFEEDNIEELLAVENYRGSVARTTDDSVVSIDNSDYPDDDEDDIIAQWYESLWY